MKTTYIKNIVFMAIGLWSTIFFAQQDTQYTNYMYATSMVNPAYTGSRGTLSLTGIYRSQWVGLEGAPTTQSFAIHSPLGENVGVGGGLLRDQIGPATETTFSGDFAYHLTLDDRDTKMAFGIKAGIHALDIDFNKLGLVNPSDPNFQNVDSKISPVIGVGWYTYGQQWYAGISSPNLLKTDHYDLNVKTTATERMHINVMAGYVFQLNKHVKFKPAMLVKAVSGAPLAIDASANFLLYDQITIGASYRKDAAISAMFGFQISNSLMIGYAYDFDTTELANYNSGSHEIVLRFDLIREIISLSPRFF